MAEFFLGILWLIGYVVSIALGLALILFLVSVSMYFVARTRPLAAQVYIARVRESEADEREVRLAIRNVGGAPAFNVRLQPTSPSREQLKDVLSDVRAPFRPIAMLPAGEERTISLGSAAALRGAGRDTMTLSPRWSSRAGREGADRSYTIAIDGGEESAD